MIDLLYSERSRSDNTNTRLLQFPTESVQQDILDTGLSSPDLGMYQDYITCTARLLCMFLDMFAGLGVHFMDWRPMFCALERISCPRGKPDI